MSSRGLGRIGPAACLAMGLLSLALSSCSSNLSTVTLRLEARGDRHEASALLAVRNEALLQAQDWDMAFWTLSNEGSAQDALLLIARSRKTQQWEIRQATVEKVSGPGQTDDAEALWRSGDHVWVAGSHFGAWDGPLKEKRQFVARFREDHVAVADNGVTIKLLEVCRDNFRLHRAINEALKGSSDVAPPSKEILEAFVAPLTADPARPVAPDDWPLNIEGAAALPAGPLLLGLRYPVSKGGHPLLVELDAIEGLFADPDHKPRVRRVLVLESAGTADVPCGIRALEPDPDGLHVHAIVGNLFSPKKETPLRQAHPNGDRALCAHQAFALPKDGAARLSGTQRRAMAFKDVEGLAIDPRSNRAVYVRDDKDTVPVLFESEGSAPKP